MDRVWILLLAVLALAVAGFLLLKPGAPPVEKPTPIEKPAPTPEKPQPEPPKEPEKPKEEPAPPPPPMEEPVSSKPRPEPSNRTTLIIDTISLPETLDPAWSFFTADSAIIEQMYEHLVDYKGGSLGEFIPELATEVPTVENGGISADGLTYTFQLRRGVTFWDGSPFTCADAEYSFERVLAMDRDSGPTLILIDPLLGITTTRDADGNLISRVTIRGQEKSLAQAIDEAIECSSDGTKITFKLAHTFPPFLQLMAHASVGSIYSKAFALANGAADNADPEAFLQATNGPTDVASTALFDKAMGTGPFRLQVIDRVAEQVILTRFNGYWQGPAALENVIWNNVPEFNTRLLRLAAGDADISYISTRAQTQQIKDQRPAGVRLIEFLPGFVTETFNLNKDIQVQAGSEFVGSGKCDGNGIPPDFFADIHVRKAFAHSFNQEQFISDFLLGAGVVAATPMPPNVEFFDPEVQAIPFDLNAAEQEFKQARCTGSDKSVWETGFKFIATYNAGNARRQAALQQLEFYIESLNTKRPGLPPFDIIIRDVPGSIFFNPNQQRITPIFVGGWSPDFIDIDNWIRQWMDAQAGTFGAVTGLSALGEKTQEWIKLLNEGITTVDKKRRQEIYSQLQHDYVEYAVAITLPTRTLDVVERSWVDGNYYNPGEGDPQEPPNVYALSKRADGKPKMEELAPYSPTVTEF